jgi:hypothetical protein
LLSPENPSNDLVAEKDQFAVRSGSQMRQTTGQVLLPDGPGGDAEQRGNLPDSKRRAQ